MTTRQRLCCLCIFLAFLWHQSDASVITTENPYQHFVGTSNDEKYEIIDVAHQNDGRKLRTGQTTRIFTTGEVDDEFWLKHLGDDFKHAIHLQVGHNENLDDIYNMTDASNNFMMHPTIYQSNINPVDDNQINELKSSENHQTTEKPTDDKKLPENQEKGDSEEPYTTTIRTIDDDPNKDVKSLENNNENNAKDVKNETKAEDTSNSSYGKNVDFKSIKDRIYLNKFEKINKQPDNFKKPTSTTHYTPSKSHYIYSKYTTTPHKYKTRQHSKYRMSEKSIYDPVVVNLPEPVTEKVHEFGEREMPIVVKMPPIIYHRNPTQYTQHEEDTDLQVPTETQTHTQTHSVMKTHKTQNSHENTEQTQEHYTNFYPNQQNYPTPYNPSNAVQHSQVSQFPSISSQSHNSEFPSYTSKFHNTPTYENIAGTIFSPSDVPGSPTNPNESNKNLRYIVRKSGAALSRSNYGLDTDTEKEDENAASSVETNFAGFSRVSRSAREFYQRGL